jgi:hypothetical protein
LIGVVRLCEHARERVSVGGAMLLSIKKRINLPESSDWLVLVLNPLVSRERMGACLTEPARQSEPALHDVQTATDKPRSLADRVSSLAPDLADTDVKARAPDAASTAGDASHPTRGDAARPPRAPASATLPDDLALPHAADVSARAAVRAFAAEVAQTAGPIVRVEGAEHRATTLRELRLLVEYVKQHSGSWIKRRKVDGAWRDVHGLKPEEVNLYDVNLNVLSRLSAELGVAYSELFSRGQQRKPKVFVSHAWSHSLLQTYEALKEHAKDRGYGEYEPIWICAFAIRQHNPEIPPYHRVALLLGTQGRRDDGHRGRRGGRGRVRPLVVRARGLLGDGRGWSRPPDRHLHAPQRPGAATHRRPHCCRLELGLPQGRARRAVPVRDHRARQPICTCTHRGDLSEGL